MAMFSKIAAVAAITFALASGPAWSTSYCVTQWQLQENTDSVNNQSIPKGARAKFLAQCDVQQRRANKVQEKAIAKHKQHVATYIAEHR